MSARSLLALLLSLLVVTHQALADADARRVVFVVSAGSDQARAQNALDAIRAQLGDLPVVIVVQEPKPIPTELLDRLDLAQKLCREQNAVGAFFVELERPDDLLLYLVEPEAKRALVRRVKKAPGAEQAGVEELSIIVRSTTNALIQGREIGMEQGPELGPKPAPPAPRAGPKTEPPKKTNRAKPIVAPSESKSTGRLGVAYVGQAYAPESPWQSGLGVSILGSPDDRLFFGLGYVAFAPVEVESDTARIRVARHPIEAFSRFEIPMERFRFAGELGVTAELARRATTQTASGVLATGNEDRWLWAVSPRALALYEVWQRTRLGVGLGLDVFLNNFQYVADLDGERRTLLSPYRARARAELGLAVDLW